MNNQRNNRYNPFSLSGKTILVTGASSGIGKAIAIEAAKMEAKLIICGRDPNRLAKTFNLLEGGGHQSFCGDLTEDSVLQELTEDLPLLDGIVHNAGLYVIKPSQFLNRETLDETLNINFFSPAVLSQKLLKGKKINRGGSIVFVSSIFGVKISAVGSAAYSASKGAINGYMKAMALEMAPKNIRVNSVNPGMVNTNLMKHNQTVTEEQLEEDRKKYPMKRYGKPEEVAYGVIFLLSDASSYITGSQLVIDGGYTLL
ncbi:MAG: SDR family oxidoreductase [Rikenellaceae bacterium]|nr:SDR family oxidoreductase [Rikenellaceae bacterium]